MLPLLLALAAVNPAAEAPHAISPDVLRSEVSFLASDYLAGRDTPSPGLDAAADFIASQFARAGLEPAGKDGYFQKAAFAAITPLMDRFQLTLNGVKVDAGRVRVTNAARADLIDVQAVKMPRGWAGGEPAPPAGSVLLLEQPDFRSLSGEERSPALAAAAAARKALRSLKPAAAIYITERDRRPEISTTLQADDPERPAFPILVVSDPAAVKALAEWPDGGRVTLRLGAPVEHRMTLRNVAGLLRGSDPELRDTYVVVSAHYDHLGTGEGGSIFHGANDDASGTASLVEIAGALRETKPKRSFLFLAFFGEEKGLLGSKYYVEHPLFPLERTVADINLEHMGRTDDNDGPRVSRASLTGFDYTNIGAMFAAAGKPLGVEFYKQESGSDMFFPASDNYSFAEAGIPAHTVAVAYIFPDYHRTGDEWPKLDYANMAKVDQAVAAAVLAIANHNQAPEWDRSNKRAAEFARKKLRAADERR